MAKYKAGNLYQLQDIIDDLEMIDVIHSKAVLMYHGRSWEDADNDFSNLWQYLHERVTETLVRFEAVADSLVEYNTGDDADYEAMVTTIPTPEYREKMQYLAALEECVCAAHESLMNHGGFTDMPESHQQTMTRVKDAVQARKVPKLDEIPF